VAGGVARGERSAEEGDDGWWLGWHYVPRGTETHLKY
jgi:hypothetical protein